MLDLVYEDNDLKITSAGRGTEVAIIVFAGIGLGFAAVPAEEFVSYGRGLGKARSFFVIDKNRTWYNAPGLYERVIERLQAEGIGSAAKRVLIGNSMGGFGAILFSSVLDADAVLSLVPQFTINQTRVPEHERWGGYIDKISTVRFEDLSAAFNQQSAYHIFHGTDLRDARHAELFPMSDNIMHYLLHGRGMKHTVAQQFKRYEILGDVLDAGTYGRGDAVFDVVSRFFRTELYRRGRVSASSQRLFGLRRGTRDLVHLVRGKRKSSTR